MTPEELEAPLTTYALNDPGQSAADRQEIEARLAGDPAARRAVEETRRLAAILTEALAAEQAATLPESVVTIPAARPAPRTVAGWTKYVVAAAVLVAVSGGTYMVWTKSKGEREQRHRDFAERAVPPSDLNNRRSASPGPFQSGAGGGEGRFGNGGFQGAGFGGGGLQGAQMKLKAPAQRDGDKGDDKQSEGAPSPDSGRPVGEVGAAKPTVTSAPREEPGQGGGEGKADPNAGPRPATTGPGGKTPYPGAGYGPGLGAPADGRPGPGTSGGRGLGTGGPGGPGMPGLSGAPGGAPGRGTGGVPAPGVPGGLPAGGATRALSGVKDAPTDAPPAAAPVTQTPPLATEDFKKSADEWGGSDRHPQLIENGFVKVHGIDALSTFGVDVDTASYAIVRNYLARNQLPPANAVRLEEMVNYFPYADKPPDGNDPFAVTVEVAECPWEPAHRLTRIGLKAKPIDNDKRPPSNLVFLIDVSGSMFAANRLPLVKASLKLLVNQLGEKDRIAMVVYAGNTGLVLDSTPASQKEKILNALDSLEAGGSTNGSGGIQQAYEVAAAHFIKGGTNRVILCTDGDWNVGTTSTDALVKMIEEKRETGVFLSVFGFGMGNLRDEMLVKLADKGNGQYGYIDTQREAQKLFVEQMSGTLVTVAKDVKIQVEFNPAVVKSYRLLGYEKRILAAKDFHDDKKDAGEMGAGHVVTALYELVPIGAPDPVVGKVDGLRYQKNPAPRPPDTPIKPDEAFVVKMRHKRPDEDKSVLREMPVKDRTLEYSKASEDFQFAAAVASFAMLLKDSAYKGQSNYGLVLELADAAKKHDPSGYRAEFIELVKKAKGLSGK